MTRSPDQLPSGKQFELRVAASELEFDARLAALTIPETRNRMPGFLHLYSDQVFPLQVEDRDIDGNSFSETQFRGLQMKVFNHNRNRFSLETDIEKVRLAAGTEELRLRVGLQLGLQAAKAIMVQPFFTTEQKERGVIPMYYTIPSPVRGRAMGSAFGEIQSYLAGNPRGIVDEMMLVEQAVRSRSIRQRQRTQTQVITAPLEIVDSVADSGIYFDDFETGESIESAS